MISPVPEGHIDVPSSDEAEPTDMEQQAAHIVSEAINNAMVNAVHVFANWYACEYRQLTPETARILARYFCQQQGWIPQAEPTDKKEK